MSNAVYVECLLHERLMQGEDSNLKCPECDANVGITDGNEYADCGHLRDSEEHNSGKICDGEWNCCG